MLQPILRAWNRLSPAPIVSAHCDVPCGIYDPHAAQIAAATVAKMVDKIVHPPEMKKDDVASIRNYHNSMTRYVMTKEEHAQKCKEELLILWTDYFKPEHLAQFPNLHDTFWKAAKLCSKNKQEVSEQAAADLVAAVNAIADIFWTTKGGKHTH